MAWDNTSWGVQSSPKASIPKIQGNLDYLYNSLGGSSNIIADAKIYTDTKIAATIGTAPATLDTLKELADALGDDPNFATTVTNLIATKAPLISPTFTGGMTVNNSAAGTNILGYFNSTDYTTGNKSVIKIRQQVGSGGSYSALIGMDKNTNNVFITNEDITKQHISITTAGKIGVGNLVPAYNVDVIGNINASTGLYSNGNAVATVVNPVFTSTIGLSTPTISTGTKISLGARSGGNATSSVTIEAVAVGDYRTSLVNTYYSDRWGPAYWSVNQYIPESSLVVERMRLDYNGRLSIGAGLPTTTQSLVVKEGVMIIDPVGSNVASGNGLWVTPTGGNTYQGFNWQMGTDYSANMYVGNGSGWVNRLSISSNGKVSINANLSVGTTNPTSANNKLEVQGGRICIPSDSGIAAASTTGVSLNSMYGFEYLESNGANGLRINSFGSVGTMINPDVSNGGKCAIGHSAPQATLHSTGTTIFGVPNISNSVPDSAIGNNQGKPFLDEATNRLYFNVRGSNGVIRSGYIQLA